MELLNLFKNKILENNASASKSTLKNYLSDVRHFISWCENTTSTPFHASMITSDILKLYQLSLGGKIINGSVTPGTQLSVSSTKRHLSSLRKFFSILEKESIIATDPFRQIIPEITQEPTDYWHIKSFKDHLLSQNASKITVKNYISDVVGFAKWYEEAILPVLENPLAQNGGFYLITQSILEDYRRRMIDIQNAAPRTVNRKLSSLRKYLEFATRKGFIDDTELTLDPVAIQAIQTPLILNQTIKLDELQAIDEPQRSYSPIPPLRILQKLLIFPYLSVEEIAAKKIVEILTGTTTSGMLSIPLKLSSELAQKHSLRLRNQALHLSSVKNVAKEFYEPNGMSLLGQPLHRKIIHHTRFTRPAWYKKYHNYAFVHYAHFALLVIFASGVGVALYQNLVVNDQKQASAAPTAPPRILSFQGRLTDNLDNPITTATDLRFAIYNDLSASGAALLWQEVDGAIPDQDGIFSIYLGEGTPIPSTVFSDNASIYLGVSVGMTPELTPRQRVATVGYATNTEFLQGLAPTTQAGITSFANVILALDSSGNLTLDDTDPTNHLFQVTNGTFALSGQTLQLTSNTGSNGSIILNPDGEGKIDLHKSLVNNTLSGNLVPGGVEVNDKFGILATESAVAAFVINNNTTGGDIIAASSSGTTRFRLTNEGSIFLIGGQSSDFDTLSGTTLNIGATTATTITLGRTGEGITLPGFDCSAALNGGKITTTAGGVLACDDDLSGSGGGSNWSLSTTNGALSPINNTLDILVGGTTTASAKFAILGVNDARGQQTASLSGSLVLDAIGNIQTTRNQTLNIGADSTGEIIVNSGSVIKLQDYTTIDNNSNSQALRLFGAAESTEIADMYVGANGNFVIDTKNGASSGQYIDFRSEDDEFGLIIRESDGTGTTAYGNIYVSDLGSSSTLLNLIPAGNSSNAGLQVIRYQDVFTRAGIGTNPTIGPQGMFHIVNSAGGDSVPGLLLQNEVNRIAVDINADNTTTNVVDITANSLTTGTALNVGGAGGVYGSNLKDLVRLVNNDTSANDNAANMSFFANRNGGISTPVASISGILTSNDQVSYTGALSFSTAGAGAVPTERLRIDGSGSLTASAYTSCTLKTDSSGLFTCGTDNTGGGGSNWTLSSANGTLSPINNTLDILVGGTTTESAKFAVLNVAGGTPTASVSAGTTGGLYITANGSLATTAKQTLNIGNSTTGIININSGSNQGINVLTGNSTTESSGLLTLATGTTTTGTSGIVSLKSGNATGASGSIALIDTKQDDHFGNVTTESVTFDSTPQDDDIILLLEAADDISPAMTPPAGFTELYYVEDISGGSLKTFAAWYKRADNEASATYTIDYGANHFRGSTIGVVFRGAISSGNPFEVVSLGPEDFDTTPEAPSINTLTDNAWHITHFFAHDTDFSAVSPPATYTTLERTPQMQMAAYKEISVAGSTGAQTVTVGASYTTGASLSLKPGVTPGASGAITIASGNSYGNTTGGALNLNTGTTDIGGTGNINLITGAASGVGDSGSVSIDVGSVGLGGTLGIISIGGTNAKAIGIGTTAPTSMLHVVGGNNGGNALAIFNQSGTSTNDILAASSSGVTKFVIKNDGTASSAAGFTINGIGSLQSTNNQTLTIGGGSTGDLVIGRTSQAVYLPGFTTNQNSMLYTGVGGLLTAATTTNDGYCLKSTTGGTPTWATCDAAVAVNVFDAINGSIKQGNSTLDFLAGGSTSSSAAFRVTGQGNPNAGTLVGASVSANTSFAGMVVDNRGSGDIFTASNSGTTRVTISSSGTLEIRPNLTGKGTIKDAVGATQLNEANSVYVSGKYAYVTSGLDDALTVIDISNPASPVQRGAIKDGIGATQLNEANSVHVSGKYAYVTSGTDDALSVIDISDPLNPMEVGTIKDAVGATQMDGANSVYVSGKYAYVTSLTDDSLTVIDISNPASPIEVGTIKDAVGATLLDGANSVYVSGKYAYVTSLTDDALTVIDISDPARPVEVDTIKNGYIATELNGAGDVFISGRYAYVASTVDDSLTVIEISGIETSAANIGNLASNNITISENLDIGNNLSIGSGLNIGSGGLFSSGTFSFSTATGSGNLIQGAPTGKALLTLNQTGNQDIFTASASGVTKFNIDASGNVDVTGSLRVEGGTNATTEGNWDPNDTNVMDFATSAVVSGKYAYVTGATSDNMTIVDISNPASPVTEGNWDPNDTNVMDGAVSVVVSGKYAYVAGGISDNMAIVDISNPAIPVTVGNWDPNDTNVMNTPRTIYISGKYAYITGNDSDNMAIVDISNPASPVTVGNWDPNSTNVIDAPDGVYISGKYAYVAGAGLSDNMAIVDISNPTSPVIVGNWKPSDANVMNDANSVYISGKYAYVTGLTSDNMVIVDVSNPASPVTVGNWDPNSATVMDGANSVFVSGKYAYVTGVTSDNMVIIDVSSPASPVLVENWDPNDTNEMDAASSVVVSGKYAYVAGENSDNLAIIDLGGIETPNLFAGSISSDTLNVSNNASIFNDLNVGNGLNVGAGGIYSQGALSIYSASSSGNLITGSPTGNALLTLNQTGTQDIFTASASGTTRFTIANNGNITATGLANTNQANTVCYNSSTGAVTYNAASGCTASSIRYKHDVSPLVSSSSLDKVLQLRPVNYRYNSDYMNDQSLQMGFIAEDVNMVDPTLVDFESDGVTPNGVKYMHMSALLASAIQELNIKVSDISENLTMSGEQESIVDEVIAQINNSETVTLGDGATNLILGNESTQTSIAGLLSAFQAEITTLTTNTLSSTFAIFDNITAGVLITSNATVNTLTSTISNLGNATVETLTVTADTMIIGGKTLQAYIIETIQNADLPFYNPELLYPIARVEEVRTGIISPLDESDIALKSQNSKFVIQNSQSEVAWFDNQGNATFSGQINADRLAVNSASISGNLATNTLTTNDATVGGTLRANNIIATNIEGLDNKIASIASGLIASSTSQTPTYSTPSAQPNGTLAVNTIQANFGIFEQGITSMGPITTNIVTATDTLSVGSTFSITNNAINTIGSDLEIQSLRQGAIAFQGGLIRMDTDGNMSINGNLNLIGTIAAVNGIFSDTVRTKALATSMISPLPGDDLVIKLSDSISTPSGKLAIQNAAGKEVLSVNSRGDIISSGAAQFAKLNFNLVGEAQASSLTEAVASGSAGFATLRTGQPEITIKNPNVTKNSLIYITPFGNTDGKVLYLLRQVPQSENADGSFTIGASGPTTTSDLQFNWLIVN